MKGVTSVKKLAAISAALVIAAAGLSGCASQSAASSAEATRENPMILSLAHGLSETHTVHIAMTEFAQNVEELTDGRIQVQIFPNGQLGSENENMEQLMAGVISMTKVSAPDWQPTMKRIIPLGCRISLTVPMIFTTKWIPVHAGLFPFHRE